MSRVDWYKSEINKNTLIKVFLHIHHLTSQHLSTTCIAVVIIRFLFYGLSKNSRLAFILWVTVVWGSKQLTDIVTAWDKKLHSFHTVSLLLVQYQFPFLAWSSTVQTRYKVNGERELHASNTHLTRISKHC